MDAQYKVYSEVIFDFCMQFDLNRSTLVNFTYADPQMHHFYCCFHQTCFNLPFHTLFLH